MSGRPDVANDLLQETYCRFLTSQLANRELAETKPFLFRIATNLLHDRWRSGLWPRRNPLFVVLIALVCLAVFYAAGGRHFHRIERGPAASRPPATYRSSN